MNISMCTTRLILLSEIAVLMSLLYRALSLLALSRNFEKISVVLTIAWKIIRQLFQEARVALIDPDDDNCKWSCKTLGSFVRVTRIIKEEREEEYKRILLLLPTTGRGVLYSHGIILIPRQKPLIIVQLYSSTPPKARKLKCSGTPGKPEDERVSSFLAVHPTPDEYSKGHAWNHKRNSGPRAF